jgi:hypothetical protein
MTVWCRRFLVLQKAQCIITVYICIYVCMYVCIYVCMYVCMWFQQLQSCKAAGSHTAQSAVWGQSETETQGFKQLMTLYAGLPAARGKILIEMYVIQNR